VRGGRNRRLGFTRRKRSERDVEELTLGNLGEQMGPTILLDKSTLQSLGKWEIYELMRYFLVTIPPTLLREILADLEKPARKQACPSDEVRILARKLSPLGGVAKVNVDFRPICVHELLGKSIPLDGVPIVGGVRRVRTSDGRRGVYLPPQPEMDAVLRWGSSQFTDSDRALAAQCRATLNSYDPDSLRRSLPPLVKSAKSLPEVNKDIEWILNDREGQEDFLRWLIALVSPESVHDVVEEWTFRRWESRGFEPLAEFAPYSRHCIKVTLLFNLAFANGLINTTRSSWVDAEYLYYTPFAEIFTSGDQLHEKLVEFVLRKDQSFARRDKFVGDLQLLANQRKQAKSGQRPGMPEVDIEPEIGSCIHSLWTRHRGKMRPQAQRRTLSEEERERIAAEFRPIVDAIERDAKQVPERVWPG